MGFSVSEFAMAVKNNESWQYPKKNARRRTKCLVHACRLRHGISRQNTKIGKNKNAKTGALPDMTLEHCSDSREDAGEQRATTWRVSANRVSSLLSGKFD